MGGLPRSPPPGPVPTPSPQPRNECSGCLPDPAGPPRACWSGLRCSARAPVPEEKPQPDGQAPGRSLGRGVLTATVSALASLRNALTLTGLLPDVPLPTRRTAGSAAAQRPPSKGPAPEGRHPTHSCLSQRCSVWPGIRVRTLNSNARAHFQTDQRWISGGLSLYGGKVCWPHFSPSLSYSSCGLHGSLRTATNTVIS